MSRQKTLRFIVVRMVTRLDKNQGSQNKQIMTLSYQRLFSPSINFWDEVAEILEHFTNNRKQHYKQNPKKALELDLLTAISLELEPNY